MDRPQSSDLVMLSDPSSPRAEAFRVLRARLESGDRNGQGRPALLITSPTTLERRHLVAANLAVAFAEGGEDTLMVDLDLHQPRLHSLFGIAEGPGILQCLTEGRDWRACLQPGSPPTLSILAAGGIHPVPSQLMGAKAMDALLGDLRAQSSTVIAVAPPAMPSSDASLLAPRFQGVILLSTAYRTTRSAMREAKARLEGSGAIILGAVLDGAAGVSAAE